MSTTGDGWITCRLGHRHWGRFGAAGLLLRSEPGPGGSVGLQLRVDWSHHGGTWGVLGGARNGDESAVEAALREAAEEATFPVSEVRLEASYVDDHGGWSYTTVIASARTPFALGPRGTESDAVRWVPLTEMDDLELHPGFAASWPLLRGVAAAPVLVVDAANVVGSRPDGWWRDRAGSVRRFRDELATGLSLGFPADRLELGGPAGLRSFPDVVLVVEGAAREVDAVSGVDVRSAEGSGDDAVVAAVQERSRGDRPVLVVTADRGLRERVEVLGAAVVGPRTLLDLVAA